MRKSDAVELAKLIDRLVSLPRTGLLGVSLSDFRQELVASVQQAMARSDVKLNFLAQAMASCRTDANRLFLLDALGEEAVATALFEVPEDPHRDAYMGAGKEVYDALRSARIAFDSRDLLPDELDEMPTIDYSLSLAEINPLAAAKSAAFEIVRCVESAGERVRDRLFDMADNWFQKQQHDSRSSLSR